MQALFGDEGGGFYSVRAESALVSRQKDVYDGALPSGNSAAALLLVRLWRLTGEPEWRDGADRQLAFVAAYAVRQPMGHCFGLLAAMEDVWDSAELIAVSTEEGDWVELARLCARIKTGPVARVKTPANEPALLEAAPDSAAYPYPETGTAYYVCKNGACQAPVYSLVEAEELLATPAV